jgi:RNA polymerase sigma-70 factor (ECF subfamily)
LETEFLVRQAQSNDKQALVSLIMQEHLTYYRLAYVYLQNPEDAADALQDMIVVLYQQIGSLKDAKAFYSWSKTILVNLCKQRLKKKPCFLELEAADKEIPDAQTEQRENSLILREAIKKLDHRYQEVIKLKYFLDYDYLSIAQIIKKPVGTVKSRVHYGLKALKEIIGGEWN